MTLKSKLILILIIASLGVWLSVVTLSGVGLAAVPAVVVLVLDQGVPLVEGGPDRLSVSRRVSQQRVVAGERVLVELTVTNEGKPIERLLLKDRVPAGVSVTRGATALFCRLGEASSATLRYEVSLLDLGDVHFGQCVARVQSLFGLTERRIDLVAPASVRMYPKLASRQVLTGRAKALSFTGSAASRLKGGRLEFMNTRQHVYGDSLRDVNWKASARLGKTLVNEWHAERGLECLLIVDMLDKDLPRVGTWSARADVIACAYELSHALVRSGNRVGLQVLGDAPLRVQPGYGPKHLRLLLDRLIAAREGTVWSPSDVESFLERHFRKQYRYRGGALFFVTASPGPDLLDAVRSLALKRFTCHTIVVDTLEEERAAISGLGRVAQPSLSMGTGAARTETEWLETQFSVYSKVYEWSGDRGFVEPRGL